ncbi:formyltetrahydrofolate deformylase [Nesterenkonia alkaliphila]|uniref:Formyltetrahydrofolate deformylase n=1 Tax=Nesterenkonia alkaliphila TaxID=1463631 RepID=A0A7K1UK11_9MICC|nr:formyltetrahydrofolate deformylase [Nesterenkonia alkaliphila]MVT26823.1 formyltetrahydrofolate deformylase [Nesterenkonia alkaliphila]GFZ81714.1 formyltetrahydrofolate deformylase [Nesterenkonia alkaliphila]
MWRVSQRPDIARLIISCPDQHGIVAAVSELIAELGGNIIALDQYSTGLEGGRFFQRTVFHLPGFAQRRNEIEQTVRERLAGPFAMEFKLTDAAAPKRVAIFASKTDHCLLDLLWRHRRGELPMEIPVVISNHPDLEEDVRRFGIDYVHVPVQKDNKSAAEAQHLEILRGRVDLVVLARYMQILSPEFLEEVAVPVINIHHSFLPAFIGAGPYQKAKDRGVKLIGATAHYVTEDLDEGPIIEQDVIRVSHADDVAQLTRYGADVERAVLSRAVKWHCEDRVIRDNNTTIVF